MILIKLGFIIFLYDKAVFINTSYQIIIICHIDDLIISGPNDNKLDEIVTEINKTINL